MARGMSAVSLGRFGVATNHACLPLQTLLLDPDLPGYQPALPDNFSMEKLAKEIERE